MEITNTLNLMQTNALFDAEAAFLCGSNAIPEYRVVELFGDEIATILDRWCCHDGYMERKDYNAIDFGESGEIRVFYRSGFYKIVDAANKKIVKQAYQTSDARKVIDAIWEERSRELARQDAEYERKLAERRAKRAAAKAAKAQESSATVNQG